MKSSYRRENLWSLGASSYLFEYFDSYATRPTPSLRSPCACNVLSHFVSIPLGISNVTRRTIVVGVVCDLKNRAIGQVMILYAVDSLTIPGPRAIYSDGQRIGHLPFVP